MKAKAICCICVFFWTCMTSFAETDWVDRFMKRYAASATQKPSAVSPLPVSLGAMIQNGAATLTTDDVVRLLLENNRDLTVIRTDPITSRYLVESAFRPFEPNLYATGTISRSDTPSSSILAGAASLIQLTHDFIVGVEQTFQTGTISSVEFEYNRFSSNSVFFVYNPSYNGAVRYSVTQPLLRNFGKLVNTSEIRIARIDEKISELEFELQVIDLVTEAVAAYWDLAFAVGDVKVKERSYDLALKTLRDNQIQEEVGTLAPLDLIQAEAEAAVRYEDLLTARYTIDQLQDEIKKMISSETDPGIVLARLNLVEPLREPEREQLLSLNEGIQFALENRLELKQAGYDIDSQDINVRYYKNQMRPIFDVTAAYTHVGLGGTQTIRSGFGQGAEIVQVIPGGVDEMFRQLFGFRFPGYSASFNIEIPLNNRAAKADYAAAVNVREQAVARKEATAQRIVLEVRNAYTQLDMNRARVATARTARLLSMRRLEAEQKKFDLGASTVRFVLEEQRNLAEAETSEIQALVNYTKSLVDYERAIGATLSRRNIQIDSQAQVRAKN
jgi:outer membrane protein TolC